MSAMTGRSSVRSPNSTRPPSRGRTRSASRPVSSLRNGAVPNSGSSPTSSPCSSTAGRGKTTTETDANFTGRPSACDALDAISVCTRGVSTTNGTATIAAIARTATTARTPTVHQRARITAERRRRLRRLDRRQTPGVGSDRARERPVLLDVLPRPRAVHNAPARVVHRVVDERDGEVHRDPVLPALLPRLRHLGAVDPNLFDPVRLPRAAQAVTLGLEARVLLRGQAIGEGAHVPTADRRLDVGERRPGAGWGVGWAIPRDGVAGLAGATGGGRAGAEYEREPRLPPPPARAQTAPASIKNHETSASTIRVSGTRDLMASPPHSF